MQGPSEETCLAESSLSCIHPLAKWEDFSNPQLDITKGEITSEIKLKLFFSFDNVTHKIPQPPLSPTNVACIIPLL